MGDGRVLDGNYFRVAQLLPVDEAIARYEGPVLIVHADADEAVPFRYGREAAARYRNCRFVPIPGDTHCYDHHLDQAVSAVRDWLLEQVRGSEIAREQLASPDTDIFTGQPFSAVAQDALTLLDSMSVEEFMEMLEDKGLIPAGMIPEQYRAFLTKDLLKQFVGEGVMMISGNSLQANLEKMGVSDPDKPVAVLIYPKDFEAKKTITDKIEAYNARVGEDHAVHYTDIVGLLIDSVTTIINAISYVLVAFVSISLVVSSIMIGIITYISVLERTKEIGILRAVGASRRDVSRVFNLGRLTGIPDIAALPPGAGLILIGVSMLLTLIAGLIPSRIASRKDPVVALRSE